MVKQVAETGGFHHFWRTPQGLEGPGRSAGNSPYGDWWLNMWNMLNPFLETSWNHGLNDVRFTAGGFQCAWNGGPRDSRVSRFINVLMWLGKWTIFFEIFRWKWTPELHFQFFLAAPKIWQLGLNMGKKCKNHPPESGENRWSSTALGPPFVAPDAMTPTMGSTSGWSIVDYTKAIVACRKHPKGDLPWQHALELLGDLDHVAKPWNFCCSFELWRWEICNT